MLYLPLVVPSLQASQSLIVVEDRGGTSALPYYEALHLQPDDSDAAPPFSLPTPAVAMSELDMLPVRTERMTPGTVVSRVLDAPGLTPFFLVGDDPSSIAWLRRMAPSLRERNAVGLVVNVQTSEALAHLRGIASGLELAPVSADDLAERLSLQHYPVLITSTGIEQ
ncbi:integrating conjugative element protein [Pseudomonas aeruginosa]|nr:integrating conjugative element protein [Pseudomonas aeruginosa]MDI3744199.1 integrating conjugative element protein [Pseudomonas aeruginosa]